MKNIVFLFFLLINVLSCLSQNIFPNWIDMPGMPSSINKKVDPSLLGKKQEYEDLIISINETNPITLNDELSLQKIEEDKNGNLIIELLWRNDNCNIFSKKFHAAEVTERLLELLQNNEKIPLLNLIAYFPQIGKTSIIQNHLKDNEKARFIYLYRDGSIGTYEGYPNDPDSWEILENITMYISEYEEEEQNNDVVWIVDADKVQNEVIENDYEEYVFIAVDTPAEFPGGLNALMSWLAQNVQYPEEAWENDVEGKVIVRFIVDKDGSVIDPFIEQSISAELDNEVLRVVNLMPKWIPASNNGVIVKSFFRLPVSFKIPRE